MLAESVRPKLLPQNRKIRHLRGISLRNLTFIRRRVQSLDDVSLNKTPGKLETLRETRGAPQLHHARSTDSVRPPAVRRRSTNIGSATPGTRQRKLEDAYETKVADVFFSLHVDPQEEPIYISEVSQRATNFDFMPFKLCPSDPSIARSPQLTVKFWTRRQETWSLLLEDEIDLRALKWLGSFDDVRFPPNSLAFQMIDGVYSLDLSTNFSPPKRLTPLPTSSYNALMKLATLDQSVLDALATRDALSREISGLLKRTPTDQVSVAADRLQLTERYLAQQRRGVAAAEDKKEEMQASILARKAAITQGRALQRRASVDVANAQDKLVESRHALAITKDKIRGQRRRICSDLSLVFYIESETDGTPLTFSICGLSLVNTEYDPIGRQAREDSLSAALGHVALLVDQLQYYLAVPLPYPLHPFGSRSSIRDDISQLADPQRDFPLHVPRGGSHIQFRLDYAWFLLNKDIESLCTSQGLRVVDIRHTLPNLKYLLYVCSAGSDEVPERKRGGIRGLWTGRMRSIGVITGDEGADTNSITGDGCEGSVDSETLGRKPREELVMAPTRRRDGNGDRAGIVDQMITLPLDEDGTRMSLRTKGLREIQWR